MGERDQNGFVREIYCLGVWGGVESVGLGFGPVASFVNVAMNLRVLVPRSWCLMSGERLYWDCV
jgi:hypothetical protein